MNVIVKNFQFNDLSGDNHFVAEPNGYRCYKAIEVNKNGGSLISKGSFSAVEIYCPPQQWFPGTWDGWKNQYKIFAPNGVKEGEVKGTDMRKPADYAYPGAEMLSLVILQRLDGNEDSEVSYHQVTATSLNSPQKIELQNQVKNLYIAINDQAIAGGANYSDNSATFEIHVRLIK